MNVHKKNCPICKSNKIKFKTNSINRDNSFKNFIYFDCINCGIIFLNDKKIKDQKSLTKFHYNNWQKKNKFFFSKNYNSSTQFSENILYHINKIKKKNSINLLDFGSGENQLLEKLKSKKKIKSISLSLSLKKNLTLKKNILFGSTEHLYDGQLGNKLNQIFSGDKCDLIILNDVIEHIYDPILFLKFLKKILNKKGIILIKTPLVEDKQFKLLNNYAWNFMAPYHRLIFSEKSIKILLDKVKFKIIYKKITKIRWGWTRALSWKSKMEKEYLEWRKNKKFVKFDIEVDKFINNNLNKKSDIFFGITNK